MTALRALLFNAVFWVWTPLLAVLYVPLLALPWRVLYAAVTWWARTMMWALDVLVGLRWELRGRERLPKGACIVAAKHQSAWDTVSLPLWFDFPSVVLKRELFQLPVWGWHARRCGMIAVDRKAGSSALKRMVAQARARAAGGRRIVIFPQGTRTAPGTHRPYLPGVAALYERLNLPVVPVALNSGLFWGRRSFLKRPGTIVVEFLDPIPPGLKRREFMAELERRIEQASDRLAAEAAQTAGISAIG
ncbi:MAG: lysophospholipid acyltransferase family protein [Rhodospirillales bacterium]